MKITYAAMATAVLLVTALSANAAHANGALASTGQATERDHLIATTSRPTYPDVTYYDCSGRHETAETHPFDSTRYIVCTNGKANDTPCPDSDPADPAHPYQVFDTGRLVCVQPNDTSSLRRQGPPKN
ncbi:carbohydrate-binding module family 14 protein [Streptomyces sp. NBC_00388]|uniref:carbohydrate-binding module family 14 protein n=1 Tax=Streptomyces sp. NBC_00388 TaxID=2975735 RepID=UPI002E1A5807